MFGYSMAAGEGSAVVVVVHLRDWVVVRVDAVDPGVGQGVEVGEVILLEFAELMRLKKCVGGMCGF